MRRSAALACRRLIGSHTAENLVDEIEMILQEFDIMAKVVKIVTDGGSNFVCAFKDRAPLDPIDSDRATSSVTIVSLRDLLNAYNSTTGVYNIRPHQRCASHRLNNIMNADVEAAKKKIQQRCLNNEHDDLTMLGRLFFEQYDSILKQCQKIWNRQQKSTVSSHT